MVHYLTLEELLQIVDQVGGVVRDTGLLDSARARPMATAFGEEVYSLFPHKAATLFESIIRNHALVDGNKRTAWLAVAAFCRLNGSTLRPTSEDAAYEFILKSAEGVLTVEDITEQFTHWVIHENKV